MPPPQEPPAIGGGPPEQQNQTIQHHRVGTRTKKQPAPSSGAAQSTAQALAQLKPPPTDAKLGSEDLPWLRLTEWEMTRLRKKMKKNAVWQPSEVMIHRELALANRGWEAYRAAKIVAEETGTEFIDCDKIEQTRPSQTAKDLEETKLSNRGMKLNEAKKLKREQLALEQALMDGDGVILPGSLPSPVQATPVTNRSSRKRKLEEVAIDELDAISAEPPTPVPAPPPIPAPVAAPPVPPAPPTALPSRSGPSRRKSSRGAATAPEPTDERGKHFSRDLVGTDKEGNQMGMWREPQDKIESSGDEGSSSEEESSEESSEDESKPIESSTAAGTREERRAAAKAKKAAAMKKRNQGPAQSGDLPPSDSEESDDEALLVNPNHTAKSRSQTQKPVAGSDSEPEAALIVKKPAAKKDISQLSRWERKAV
ncbi:unnamed protein product [Penicillium salamii]|uniref:Uncharacterized protein n=1 Tax=Penicillium salamii TaxID=1612424 RepID=A0A9W4JM20_9EURO|nr:unnamed protein product [Penicillium salamii]